MPPAAAARYEWCPFSSNVDCVSERLQCGLVKAFALGRMRMDGSGNVFEACAHLDCKAEDGRQFGNASSHALNAKQHMIVSPRHDADEPVLAIQGQGPPVRPEWKEIGLDVKTPGLCLVRRKPCGHDL